MTGAIRNQRIPMIFVNCKSIPNYLPSGAGYKIRDL